MVPLAGVSVSNVDMADLQAVRAAIQPGKTKLVMVESPTNPRMQVRGGKEWGVEMGHARGGQALQQEAQQGSRRAQQELQACLCKQRQAERSSRGCQACRSTH